MTSHLIIALHCIVGGDDAPDVVGCEWLRSAGTGYATSGILMAAGASDCASQIAVMLEAARTLVADKSVKLVAPVVFAFNGGEETFSQVRQAAMWLLHLFYVKYTPTLQKHRYF